MDDREDPATWLRFYPSDEERTAWAGLLRVARPLAFFGEGDAVLQAAVILFLKQFRDAADGTLLPFPPDARKNPAH